MIARLLFYMSVAVSASRAAESLGFDSGVPDALDRTQRQTQYRPFGSDRPCSALVNETLTQNDAQVIVERILITADTMGTSFSSSSFTGGSNQQLDTWASQACGQMQNVVGYLKSACQYGTTSGSGSSSSQEIVAQKKVAAMSAVRDYLCNNNQVNLKEMAMNNGAQCARKTDLNEMGCNINMGSQPSFIPMLPPATRQSLKYGTAIALSMFSYNGDECRYISDVFNCILDKYNRGSDFCSPRAATHFGRIFDTIQQGVQCRSGGFSTFNNFDTSNSFNNNPSFNRFPSNNFPNSNSNNFPNSNSNNFPNNNFPQNSNFPQGNTNWGQNPQNVGSNWPQNQNSNWGQNSGWNNNQNNPNNPSNPNNPNNPNSFGNSGSNSWQNQQQQQQQFGLSSFSSQSGSAPPYNPYSRKPYGYNSGTVARSAAALIVTTVMAAMVV